MNHSGLRGQGKEAQAADSGSEASCRILMFGVAWSATHFASGEEGFSTGGKLRVVSGPYVSDQQPDTNRTLYVLPNGSVPVAERRQSLAQRVSAGKAIVPDLSPLQRTTPTTLNLAKVTRPRHPSVILCALCG